MLMSTKLHGVRSHVQSNSDPALLYTYANFGKTDDLRAKLRQTGKIRSRTAPPAQSTYRNVRLCQHCDVSQQQQTCRQRAQPLLSGNVAVE